MKILLTFLMGLFVDTGFVFAETPSSRYTIDLRENTAEITVTRGDRTRRVSHPIDSKDLSFISSRSIAELTGDKEKASTHLFSFANPENVEVKINCPKNKIVFSSFKNPCVHSETRRISQFVIGIAPKGDWQVHSFDFQKTRFELVSPKKEPNIDSSHWKQYVSLIWNQFTDRFGVPTDHVVFADLRGPISGGPLGENVLGIFAMNPITTGLQKDIKANLGWNPQPSTKAYIRANYPKSTDPWGEYLIGTYAHEMGHLFFGFGMTRQLVKNAHELWFSLGTGMVFDMEITQSITGNLPQLEVAVIDNWKNNVSQLKDVDQHLILPNQKNDEKYDFDRKKVFGHGKAAFFMNELRMALGKETFDKAITTYLRDCRKCLRGYEDFKKFLPEKEIPKIIELEKKLSIQ